MILKKILYIIFAFSYWNVCFPSIYYVDSKNKSLDIDNQVSAILKKIAKADDLHNVIEFLPGIYHLNKSIQVTLNPNHSIQLKGHGVGTTTLYRKSGSISQGITIHFESTGPLTGHKGSISVQNMSLINDSETADASAITLLNRSKIPGGAETPTKILEILESQVTLKISTGTMELF